MISYTIKFTAKNSRTAIFQESLAMNFKWNALTARILRKHMPSKLVDIFLTVAPFLCTQSVILDFCSILVAANNQFVILKPISYCFKETMGFDLKPLFASPSESRLIK